MEYYQAVIGAKWKLINVKWKFGWNINGFKWKIKDEPLLGTKRDMTKNYPETLGEWIKQQWVTSSCRRAPVLVFGFE